MPELNRERLSDVFDINNNPPKIIEPVVLEPTIHKDGNEVEEDLKGNIDRANRILDLVEEELENGNFSSRLVEVAGQLVNAVTNASKELDEQKSYHGRCKGFHAGCNENS